MGPNGVTGKVRKDAERKEENDAERSYATQDRRGRKLRKKGSRGYISTQNLIMYGGAAGEKEVKRKRSTNLTKGMVWQVEHREEQKGRRR